MSRSVEGSVANTSSTSPGAMSRTLLCSSMTGSGHRGPQASSWCLAIGVSVMDGSFPENGGHYSDQRQPCRQQEVITVAKPFGTDATGQREDTGGHQYQTGLQGVIDAFVAGAATRHHQG